MGSLHYHKLTGQVDRPGERKHQMAYISQKTEDLVLSQEALMCLDMVNDIDNSAASVASVRQISYLGHLAAAGPSVPAAVAAVPAVQAVVVDKTRE